MKIEGQDFILSKIDSLTLDTFPRSLIILGQEGSGRHSLINYIREHLSLNTQEISGRLTYDTIEEINNSVYPMIYTINADDISYKEQNSILKFLEEPLKNAYIILICSNKDCLLPTIKNRCIVWELERYSKDILSHFCSDPAVLEIAETPGQAMSYAQYSIPEIIDYVDKIYSKLGIANLPNSLNISDMIAYKEEKDKYSVSLFNKILIAELEKIIKKDRNPVWYKVYKVTSEYLKDSSVSTYDKRYLFEKWILSTRKILRGD